MNIFSRKKGFTLIETLVAVAVLLVAVAAVFTAARSGLSSSSALRNRVTATYLAEEGMNGVKNIKDSNLLRILNGEPVSWMGGISNCTQSSKCGYDVLGANSAGALDDCATYDGCRVKMGVYGIGGNIYRQMNASQNNGSTVDTGFVRRIYVERTPGLEDKEAKVTVEITRPNSNFQMFTVTSYLYNFWPTP